MSAKTQNRSGGGKNVAKKPRVVFLDYLRAFAPLLVICVHICTRSPMDGEVAHVDFSSWDYVLLTVIARICRIAVPIFCMITGALFLDPKRKFDHKKHFTKTIPRIILIYVVWSLIYAFVVAYMGTKSGKEFWPQFIQDSLSGCWHLWYLKMLIGIYLLVPLFRKITESKALTSYAVKLIVFVFAMTTIGKMIELLAMNAPDNEILASISKTFSASFVHTASFVNFGFIAYCFLGYFLANTKFKKKEKLVVYILGVLGLIMTIVFPVAQARTEGVYDYGVAGDGLGCIGMLFFSAAVFLAAREVLSTKKQTGRMVAFMARHSLGIYVLHALPLIIICHFYNIPLWHLWSMVVLIPGCTVIVYGVSLLVSWILSKIPLVKKVV